MDSIIVIVNNKIVNLEVFMTLDEIRARLKDRRIDKIAEESGLSRTTIANVRDGENKNPTLRTTQLIIKYLEEHK